MKTLIKMTDYLPDHPYSKFLKLSPEIWMFVPCKLVDGVWVVLEEPEDEKLCKYCPIEESQRHASAHSVGCEGSRCDVAFENYKDEYETAFNHVIFDCEILQLKKCNEDEYFLHIKSLKKHFTSYFKNGIISEYSEEKTIEDLIPYNLTLTATAQKEIGL